MAWLVDNSAQTHLQLKKSSETVPVRPTHPIELDVIASGSKGNASLVQCDEDVFMIDCGVTRKAFLQGCADADVDPKDIHSILITHEHSDHTKGLGVVLREMSKRGAHPALFTLDGVREQIPHIEKIDGLYTPEVMDINSEFSLGALRVSVFPTSHDAMCPVGFRITSADDALGFMTDSGCVLEQAEEKLQNCRILAIEANYDVEMLKNGPYPQHLKQRIKSDSGHLSNDQCAQEVAKLATPRLEHVIAMHISEHNNTYGQPVRAIEAALQQTDFDVQVHASSQRHSVIVK